MATKRAGADANELQSQIYADSGIYYSTDDSNILKGFACVLGPKGTPYEDFPAFFSVSVGPTYPFDPPKLTFLSCDGHTRFHPNLYDNGKVCLSVLHTWSGPRWASTMRLSTIFLTLQSILDTHPLKNEPGFENGKDEKVAEYSEFVEYKCLEYTLWLIQKLLSSEELPHFIKPFEEILKKRVPKQLDNLQKRLEEKIQSFPSKYYNDLPYSMVGQVNYKNFLQKLVKLKAELDESSR